MKTKLIALLVGALMLLTIPAVAQDTFVGFGTATGLELSGAQEGDDPMGLIFGFSEAAVQSAPAEEACGDDRGNACARGAGELLQGDSATAHAPGNEGPEEVGAGEVPEDAAPLLSAAFGIGRAEAGANDVTVARGDGGAFEISVNITETLGEEAADLFDPVREGLEDFSETVLGPIAEGDPSEEVGPLLKETFDLIVAQLGETPLVTLRGGASETIASDEAGVTTVTAQAQGTRIIILPFPDGVDLPGDPDGFIEIESGDSSATVTSDRVAATAEADPAALRVKLYNASAGEFEEIDIAPPDDQEPVEIGEDPLVARIWPAGSATQVDGAGASAQSAAVRIELFSDPLPELTLSLAYAEAAVNAQPAPEPTPTPTPTPPAPAPDLPRTGADVAVAGLALLGIGAASWYGVRRRKAL